MGLLLARDAGPRLAEPRADNRVVIRARQHGLGAERSQSSLAEAKPRNSHLKLGLYLGCYRFFLFFLINFLQCEVSLVFWHLRVGKK